MRIVMPGLNQAVWGPVNNAALQNLDDRVVDLEVAGRPTWLDGAGAPATSLGRTGDWYLNTDNGDVYKKTDAVTWALFGNLEGPPGPPGLPGVNAVPADEAVGTYVATDGTNSANSVDARVKRALPFITPEMFGAVGDGTTDDSAAIIAMFAAAKAAGGANCILSKRYAVRGRIIQPGGVHVFGGGVRRVLGTDDHKDRGLVALDNTFVYQYGAWGSGSIDDNPGKIDGLNIDGAGVGGATHLFEMQCVDGAIVDTRIVNSAGDAVELGGSQNSTFERCVVGYSIGSAWSCNQTGGQGAGQVKVNNSYVSDSAVLVKPTGDPAQFPSHDIFYTQCLFENHQIGDNIGSLLAGDMRFTRCTFTNSNAGTVPADALVKVSQDVYPAYSTTVEFNSCYWNGGANADKPAAAVWVKSASGGVGNIVVFTGHHQVTNVDAVIAVEGTTVANDIRDNASWYLGSGVAMYSTAPGGSLFGVLTKRRSPVMYSMPDDSSGSLRSPLMFRRDTDAQNRFEVDRDGGHYWRDGTSTTVRASKTYSSSLVGMVLGGTWQFSNALIYRQIVLANVTTTAQPVAFSGAATASPSQIVQFTLNGASAAATITGGSTGSQLRIVLDATTLTAGQTASITWPSNIKTDLQPVQGKSVAITIELVGSTWIEVGRGTGTAPAAGGVTSVNGYTGAVTLAKADVGLSNVPNVDTTNASNITTGTLPNSVLPALAISDTFLVASQAAMLALTAQRGDVAIRSDINTSFILSTDSPSTLADWKQLLTPSSGVTSVNGYTGAAVLTRADFAWRSATTATAAATAAKTVTISGYTPAAGDRLDLTLTNGNTVGAPTLNINSGGAVGIYYGGGVATLENVFSGGNVIWPLYYDGSRWNLIAPQSDFTQPSTAEAQAGTGTTVRWWTAALIAAAIKAQTALLVHTVQTANYTLALTDGGQLVEMNAAGALTVTIPLNSSVAFPVDTVIQIRQQGAGQVTVSPASGVTLRTPSSATTRTQYSTLTLHKRATDEWVLSGDAT